MILETKETIGISTDKLLANWQGQRSLTRKTIEAFSEKELFDYSVGGMRPFAEIVMELVMIAEEGMNGILTGKWKTFAENTEAPELLAKKSKSALLAKWDQVTNHINEIWPQLDDEHFHKFDKAFGAYENTNLVTIQYAYDNEIHHRGQGFVYLRTLGIQPPFFWER